MSTQTKAQKSQKTTESPKVALSPNGKKNGTLTKVDDILNPTAEGRLKKLENFNLLAKRHHSLLQKQDELNKFIISSDGTKERIVMQNADDVEFVISNTQVVEKVLKVVETELETFIGNSEKEVLSYTI